MLVSSGNWSKPLFDRILIKFDIECILHLFYGIYISVRLACEWVFISITSQKSQFTTSMLEGAAVVTKFDFRDEAQRLFDMSTMRFVYIRQYSGS